MLNSERTILKGQIAKQDFNLLKVLHVLFQECSVRAAANKIHLSPSAINKALQRLRAEFEDPLFISSQQGLIPTKMAEQIGVVLKDLFDDFEMFNIREKFDKRTFNGSIRIAAPEQFSVNLIPKLLAHLQKTSPNTLLESLQIDNDYVKKLSSGKIDFAVCIDQTFPKELHSLLLHSADPIFWVKKNHPLLKKSGTLTLEDIYSYPQVAFHNLNFSKSDRRFLSKKIVASGLTLDIIVETEHLMIALDTLLETEAVMMTPDNISSLPNFSDQVQPIPLKNIFGVEQFKIDIFLVWHKKYLNSDLHQWISEEIADIF